MAVKKLKNLISFTIIFCALLGGLVSLLSSCETPMGLGKPIDFEPPELDIDPIPTPLYVRTGTVLTGTVTDNIGVDRVIMRNSIPPNKIISDVRAVIKGSRWEMRLDFDKSRNGEKMMVDIVAFDKMGNSGDKSIKTITIIIDTNPPMTEEMTIKRSDTREAFFESYDNLKLLREDLRGSEKIANVNRFQNGFFHVLATINEEETRINDTLRLNIYDIEKDINQIVLQIEITKDSSLYSPKWLISEADILNAGDALWPGYSAAYENGASYIYRVATEVHDRSLNEGLSLIEEEGCFIMSYNADIPKGNLDTIIGTTVDRGGTIPVEFFDDDTLEFAYVGFFTYEQWNGVEDNTGMSPSQGFIAPGVKIQGTNDEDKYAFLETRLLVGDPVYNWRYDRYAGDTSEPVDELIGPKSLDEKMIYIITGNSDADYGAFVLFSFVGDKKLSPHTNDGPKDTNKSRSKSRHWPIDVIDANAPLIVLDVNNGCPEENTFPTPLSGGEFFTIKGYTLRENGNSKNGVIKLRMAWIPFGKQGGADRYIQAVQEALSAKDYPKNLQDGSIKFKDETFDLNGIQYWDFDFADFNSTKLEYDYKGGSDEKIGSSWFRNQPFERRFSVLGNFDPAHPGEAGWKDFHYNGVLENENKLFVIFAECNMGHKVYRQMRLLSNKTPPTLYVYDISRKISDAQVKAIGPQIPDIGAPPFTGSVTPAYDAALKLYNEEGDVYDLLRSASYSAGSFSLLKADEAIPFQMYTRGTILKYWVNAKPNGDLKVKNIRIKDITFDTVCTCPGNQGTGADKEEARKNCDVCAKWVGSKYNGTDNSVTFIEYYPDEAQRVFLFEAEDSLGNIARMQRTIAATNAARLEKITTTTLDGTYGIGTEIILQAEFSGLIRVEGDRPQLNVRYPYNNNGVRAYRIASLEGYIDDINDNNDFVNKTTLNLKFKLTVTENMDISTNSGVITSPTHFLETMYAGAGMGGSVTDETDRPLKLTGTSRIIDVNRDQHAFIPGYTINNVGMPNWTTASGSLQGLSAADGKKIALDGIRPKITGVSIGGKTAYSTNTYYFKNGETIELTLKADKPILNSETPQLSYIVTNLSNGNPQTRTNFVYSRQGAADELIFSLPVIDAPAGNGQIRTITIDSSGTGKITDRVGNELIHTTGTAPSITSINLYTSLPTGTNIYIKKTLPTRPVVTLTNASPALNVQLQSAAATYNHGFTMTISNATGDYAAWEDKIQYSKNGGLDWADYTPGTPISSFPNDTYNIRARYVDRAGNEGYQRHRCLPGTPNSNADNCQDERNYSCAGTIQVNSTFPKLLSIAANETPSTYTTGNLNFTLSFDANVNVATAANVSITLADTNANANTPGGTGSPNTYTRTLTATAATNTRDVKFSWALAANTYDMLAGLQVTAINISGLTDSFGNTGPAVTCTSSNASVAAQTGVPTAYSVGYNLTGTKVSTITPTIRSRQPQNAQGRTGNITTNETDGSISGEPGTGTELSFTAVAGGSISSDNKTIRLTFSKPMQKGNGTITIRPHGNYAIPAVFENEGYYVGITSTGQIAVDTQGFEYTYATSAADSNDGTRNIVAKTWVAGFSDIFNNVGNDDKMTLIGSNSMAAPTLSATTGLSVGPYLKTTHGLKRGAGYTGNYNNSTPASNAPGTTGTDYMIPDISTKWVLRYSIEDIFGAANTTAENTVVTNIRSVLYNAKFRWQEIAVTQSNVEISADKKTVIINLPEPLLPGLQWRLSYPAGTFADEAGTAAAGIDTGKIITNNAAGALTTAPADAISGDLIRNTNASARNFGSASPTGNQVSIPANAYARITSLNNPFKCELVAGQVSGQEYWFWSSGVQKPVIRVDRKSYDARAATNISSGPQQNLQYTANGHAGQITDYNTIAYRIVSETPNSRIFYSTKLGSDFTASGFTQGSALGAWSGSINETTLTGITSGTVNTWEGNKNKSGIYTGAGTWVRPNLIFRNNRSGSSIEYTVLESVQTTRAVTDQYFGLRSYNKDATVSELNITDANLTNTNTAAAGRVTANIAFGTANALQASKNYVIAKARVDHSNVPATGHNYSSPTYSSEKGYEGIFRTVLMMNQVIATNGVGTNISTYPPRLMGTNRQSGLPTIAGFPLKDNAENIDTRYMKVIYLANSTNKQWYWVTSEIISQIFIQIAGYGIGQSNGFGWQGDSRDWMTMGYGDLTYTLGLNRNTD